MVVLIVLKVLNSHQDIIFIFEITDELHFRNFGEVDLSFEKSGSVARQLPKVLDEEKVRIFVD